LEVCSLDRIQAGVANLCASHVKWTIEAHTLLVRATVLATLSEHLQGDLIVALGGKAFATLCFPHREADITPSDNDDAEPGPYKLARLFKVKKPLLLELDLPLADRIGILLDLFRTRIVPQIAFTDEKGRAFFISYLTNLEFGLEELQECLDTVPENLRELLDCTRTLFGGLSDTPSEIHMQSLEESYLKYAKREVSPQSDCLVAICAVELKDRVVFVTANKAGILEMIRRMDACKASFTRCNGVGITIGNFDGDHVACSIDTFFIYENRYALNHSLMTSQT